MMKEYRCIEIDKYEQVQILLNYLSDSQSHKSFIICFFIYLLLSITTCIIVYLPDNPFSKIDFCLESTFRPANPIHSLIYKV